MKIIRSYIDNIGKAQPGIAAEKEHIERPSERSLQFRSDILQPSLFLRCQMATLALHIFNLILTKRIFLQFKQILINRQVDISFQMLHMLGNRIPVVLLLKKKMFKTTKEIKGKIIKRDLWLILAQNLQSG